MKVYTTCQKILPAVTNTSYVVTSTWEDFVVNCCSPSIDPIILLFQMFILSNREEIYPACYCCYIATCFPEVNTTGMTTRYSLPADSHTYSSIILLYHTALSYSSIIQLYHTALSYCSIIQLYHTALSYCSIILLYHTALSCDSCFSSVKAT